MIEIECGLEGLEEFAKTLSSSLPHHCVILLRGDLASGKTTLLSTLLNTLGSTDTVTSPTFGLQHIYKVENFPIFHYDLYRKDLQECLMLGFLESFDQDGWHWVEWGDERLEEILRQSGFKVVIITIDKQNQSRKYRVEEWMS